MTEYDFIQAESNYHCPICSTLGGKIPRYGLEYTIKNGHTWTVGFPCIESRQDFLNVMKPFISNYKLIGKE